MDKYDFMAVVADTFGECDTEQEIDSRAEEMINILEEQKELSKQYLRIGIL